MLIFSLERTHARGWELSFGRKSLRAPSHGFKQDQIFALTLRTAAEGNNLKVEFDIPIGSEMSALAPDRFVVLPRLRQGGFQFGGEPFFQHAKYAQTRRPSGGVDKLAG